MAALLWRPSSLRGKLDEKMSALVGIELAARAAQTRLPHAQAALEEARAAAMRAEVETMKAGRNLLMVEAAKTSAPSMSSTSTRSPVCTIG